MVPNILILQNYFYSMNDKKVVITLICVIKISDAIV